MDRLGFICHRPEFAGKTAYLIATVGIGPTKHALKTLKMALSTWGYAVVGQSGFKMGALMNKTDAKEQFDKKTKKIAAVFYGAIKKQRAKLPSFLSLMTFRIQQGYWLRNPLPGEIDYEFWVEQGWLDSKSEFYISHQASHIKVKLARLAGALLTPFVT